MKVFKQFNWKKLQAASIAAFMAFSIISAIPMHAKAAVLNPAPAPKVTFTFDDGNASVYSQAKPTLAKYGLTGTAYIITGCVGMTATPNTCHANTGTPYVTWSQVEEMKTAGWDIGSHTVTHPYLATSDATDGQPNVLTPAQVDQELSQSKAALAAHGIDAVSFASPYGDYNNPVLASVAKYYESQRGFQDIDNNVWSYNDYIINDMQVQAGVTVAQVKSRIDAAIANNHWLVLTFHDIKVTPSTNPNDYEYATADLDAIAAYAKSKMDANQLKVVNVKDGLVKSDTNLLTNGGFTDGFNTWSTNAAANVKLDSASHGAYPNPANAVSITGGATSVSLFAQPVAVDSTQTYMVKSFLNLQSITAGELGFYIDEYNSAGAWISGKWIDARTTPAVRNVNFTYTPSSVNVKKASLQVYATANSGVQAYMDNFQFFSLNGSNTPAPTTNNLLPSGDFNSGLAAGWSTDNAAAYVPQSGAIKLTSQAASAHLFAPKVNVLSTSTYTIKAALNLQTLTSGETAFYIDEYDANGAWISGQYAYAKRNASNENVSFTYIPTSANVKQASVQTILTANSGITGTLDNLQFLAPVSETPPAPTPDPTNLVANGTFDNGIADGWTTNAPATIVADNGNHGAAANPVNAVKVTATTANTHLFSPLVTVQAAKTYSLAVYSNITALTAGELGYYIDEYDVNGNWISGQYKTGVRAVGSGDTAFTYTPSSANVAKASLQIIVVGNSGLVAYVDHIRWFQN